MKRRYAAVLVLVFLLFGCGKEIDETIPNETKEAKSCINIRAAESETDFGSFKAQAPEDAGAAREIVEDVLNTYPAALLAQLGPVEILLVGELTGEDRFAHGNYAGFTQRSGDGWQMVLDAAAFDAGTVHHELAHILDGILTEAGALTEETWMAFCPEGFVYGEPGWEDCADFFVDEYAMTDMREDRARVFEAAVLGGEGVFADRPALWLKLEYLSRTIREHFDPDGWPERTIWEIALE